MKFGQGKSELKAGLVPEDDPFGFKKLKSLSLDEIYNNLDKQFSSKEYFTSFPISMKVECDDVDSIADITITPGQQANEYSLDTQLLSFYLAKNLGKLLINFPCSEKISPWVEKLDLLYEKAREYEDDLYEKSKPLTKCLEGLARSLSIPPTISGIIKGARQILVGYVNPTPLIDLDKETLNIYQISCWRKMDRIQELGKNVDSLLRGMGQLVALPNGKHDGNLLKIDIFHMLSHKLFEYDINFLGRDLKEGSEEERSVNFQSRKFHAATEILWECSYNRTDENYLKSRKPISDALRGDPIVAARYKSYVDYSIKNNGSYAGLREDFAYLLKIGVPLSAFGIPDEVEGGRSC